MSYFVLRKDAAAGVDGVTWAMYGEGLEERLLDLHRRLHSGGAYRAPPVRRVEIPKPDGGIRPLGIAALEDKIVQKAVVDVILTPIYEAEFLGLSYGFRPGRGAHDALDALAFGIERRKVNWIVDADLKAYFDTIPRDWLITFLEYRIGDRRVTRLIRKWLKAGVMDDGTWTDTGVGTPQGNILTPRTQKATSRSIAGLRASGSARSLIGDASRNTLMANDPFNPIPEVPSAECRLWAACRRSRGRGGRRADVHPVRPFPASSLSVCAGGSRDERTGGAVGIVGSHHPEDPAQPCVSVAGACPEQRSLDGRDCLAGPGAILPGFRSSWLTRWIRPPQQRQSGAAAQGLQ